MSGGQRGVRFQLEICLVLFGRIHLLESRGSLHFDVLPQTNFLDRMVTVKIVLSVVLCHFSQRKLTAFVVFPTCININLFVFSQVSLLANHRIDKQQLRSIFGDWMDTTLH